MCSSVVPQFNLVTEDLDVLKEDLKFWRTQAINPSGEEPPPMKIDIFLDVSELSQNQILVVVDETLRRNRIDLSSNYSVDLPNLYKRSIVFFRSLHSYVRLLPAYNLYRRLRKYGNISQLRLGYRMVSVDVEQSGEIGIDASIVEHDARSPTKSYEFADIMTPLGHFNLKVEYRRNCDFQVDDMERDLSARFIDMDEHYFTPTMAKYQQEQDMQRTRSASSYEGGSVKAKGTITGFKPVSVVCVFHIGRKPSATNISPFKSPSLSSSPIQQSGSDFAISQSKYYSSPTGNNSGSNKGFSYQSAAGEDGASSGSRKVEFSSSFDRYKGSPSRGDIATGMSRRLSRNSDHSLYSSGQDSDSALEEFMQFVQSKQELKMFSNRGSTTATPDNESTYDDSIDNSMMASGSMYKSKKALSRFQALRESHDNLTESMTASMMGQGMAEGSGGRNYGSPSYTGISPTSSSSSQSRYYQPVVPSPLHAEQRVGPIHIPRDMSAPTTSSHLHRRQLSHDSQTNVHSSPPQTTMSPRVLSSPDRAAYSSYPTDPRHKDLKRLPPRMSRSPPDKTTSPRGARSGSLLDDDDSLVFKMSELGNETGTFDSGVYNNQYQGSLYSGGGGGKDSPRQRLLVGPNSHFATVTGSPKIGATTTSGGEAMSRRASSGSGVAMATVMEQEEPNTASSNSSSSSTQEPRASGPDAHMFSGDW
ncbi:autophagy-related protein 13-domain-containing protein [Umbelopsis sp. PMI_123]|nr:autophagy-related protein 13-domain-containing protein [Umbelopsis sp. PMI_123]